MNAIVSARGYTSVIMVMNLSRFIHPEDKNFFHALRGSKAFHQVMEEQWHPKIKQSRWFNPVSNSIGNEGSMSPADAGFATGVFRQYLLETALCHTYQFNKPAYESEFPAALKTNFQFKNIFLPVWGRWEIFVRPSVFGMLVIRLTRRYPQSTPLEQIASDVVKLQAPFDVYSATRWLKTLEEKLADDTIKLEEKRRSVQELLHWLQRGHPESEEIPHYSPAQWQLAMEISKAFVQSLGCETNVHNRQIRFSQPQMKDSHPLHDAYVIYHIDALNASPYILPSYRRQMKTDPQKAKLWAQNPRFTVPVTVEDLFTSKTVRQRLRNLLEGSLLRHPDKRPDTPDSSTGSARYFPRIRLELLDVLREQNLATWHDELCVMNSHAALIIPSHKERESDLFISTLPTEIKTSRVTYTQYWQAVELLIEFVAEVRVLAQLIEHSSTHLLQNCVEMLHKTRRGVILRKSPKVLQEFNQVISQTANLSRLLAIAQTLNNPASWSRTDFALSKATYLLNACHVPASLQHAAENITNLNALVEHLDELFLADSASQRERLNFLSSMAITALSLVLTILMLPSFWADLKQLGSSKIPSIFSGEWLTRINFIGSWLAVSLIIFSIVILLISVLLLINNLFHWYKQRTSTHQ